MIIIIMIIIITIINITVSSDALPLVPGQVHSRVVLTHKLSSSSSMRSPSSASLWWWWWWSSYRYMLMKKYCRYCNKRLLVVDLTYIWTIKPTLHICNCWHVFGENLTEIYQRYSKHFPENFGCDLLTTNYVVTSIDSLPTSPDSPLTLYWLLL